MWIKVLSGIYLKRRKIANIKENLKWESIRKEDLVTLM